MKEKEKIISFSKNIFLKEGFYKITMDELASGLRISKKTIYKYFPSKNKLIDTVVNNFQKKTKKQLNKIIEEQNNSIQKIKALTNFMVSLSFEVSPKILYDLQIHRPDLWNKIDKFRTTVIENVWEKIINSGKKEKYIINKPNDIIIALIIASVRGVVNPEFLLTHNYSIKEAYEITFEIIITGILTEKGKKLYYKSIAELKK